VAVRVWRWTKEFGTTTPRREDGNEEVVDLWGGLVAAGLLAKRFAVKAGAVDWERMRERMRDIAP